MLWGPACPILHGRSGDLGKNAFEIPFMCTDRSQPGAWDVRPAEEASLSFVVRLSDDATLKNNLLGSECLGPGSPHEVTAVRNAPIAAAGLNLGLREPGTSWSSA